MPAGSVTVTYVLPISGNGKVELHVNAPLALEDHDREFILAVLDKVGEIAGLACPGAERPEAPAALSDYRPPPGSVCHDTGEVRDG
jgi:hypothetical protein